MPNLATVIVAALVAVVFLLIIINGIRKKKKGKGSCSCGCSGCAMSEICHSKK